ncbi:MAG: MFS transporter, partial [Methanomicrobiales archaeon]|nr:MFS transporter [Methanomicrobiales archaeon]
LGTMRLVGQTLSMGVAVIILAVTIGKVTITPALYEEFLAGMQIAFLSFGVLCMIGIIFSLIRGTTGPETMP